MLVLKIVLRITHHESGRTLKARKQFGAGDGIQTRDLHLGKVALYQLSYSRECSRTNEP